jgi:hypothetical protein
MKQGGAGSGSEMLADAAEGGSVVTAALLSDYGGGSSGGSVAGVLAALRASRVPAAPTVSSRDAIREEALNLIAMTNAQTPLLGGENAPLAAGMGFEGATPSLRRPAGSSSVAGSGTDAATPLLGNGISSSASSVAGSRRAGGTSVSCCHRAHAYH